MPEITSWKNWLQLMVIGACVSKTGHIKLLIVKTPHDTWIPFVETALANVIARAWYH